MVVTPPADLALLAERALARLAPLRFELATAAQERDEVFRSRCDCVVAEGWVRREDVPDGRLQDADDAAATLVVCRDAGALAGSLRLIVPGDGRGLPIEREFGVRARPPGRVVEAGRLVVATGARASRSHRIVAGLFARSWLELSRAGYQSAISTATPQLIELYAAFGLRVSVLGPAREHWGARRAPIQLAGGADSFGFLTR